MPGERTPPRPAASAGVRVGAAVPDARYWPDAVARGAVGRGQAGVRLMAGERGTGTTTVLVRRMCTLITRGCVPGQGGVTALTPSARTAEIFRERLRAALAEAAGNPWLPAERRAHAAAAAVAVAAGAGGLPGRGSGADAVLALPDFAERLLRRHAARAGVPADFTVLDAPAARLARAQWWRRTLAALGARDDLDRLWHPAAAHGVTPDSLWPVAEVLHANAGRAARPDPPPGWPAPDSAAAEAPEADFAELHEARRAALDRGAAERAADERDQIGAAGRSALGWVLAWLWDAAEADLRARRARGALHPCDVLALARTVLAMPDARAQTRAERPVVLVDGVTGPDPYAVELVRELIDAAGDQDGTATSPELERVVVAADPADMGVLCAAGGKTGGKTMGKAGGAVETLTVNCRARPPIVAAVDAALGLPDGSGPALPAQGELPGGTGERPLRPGRRGPPASERDGPDVLLLGGPVPDLAGPVGRVEAEHVAALCRRAVGGRWQVRAGTAEDSEATRDAGYRDVAVLVPGLPEVAELARALAARRVPYQRPAHAATAASAGIGSDRDAVRIETVDGARGREWPITVVLGAVAVAGRRARSAALVADGRIEASVGEVATPGWADAAAQDEARRAAIRRRALACALTRAADHLVVSLYHPAEADAAAAEPAGLSARLPALLRVGAVHERTPPPPEQDGERS